MTIIHIKDESHAKESWTFIYSVYGSVLAVMPLFINFLPINWASKVAIFYVAFLALSFGTILNPKGRKAMMKLKRVVAG